MQTLTLPETTSLIKADLVRRFPGCQFSVRSQAHAGAVVVRWLDGPTQSAVENAARAYLRPNTVGGALAGAGAILSCRLYSLATVTELISKRARYYASRVPAIAVLNTDGVEHADLEPIDGAGQPISFEDLRPWRYALEQHNAYVPPAKPVEEDAATPAGKLAALARFYVASGNESGGLVAVEVLPAPAGGHWLRFSGFPSNDVLLALTGALNARWDRFRKVWTTHASLDRILAVVPAA